jgi:hypothetical protein
MFHEPCRLVRHLERPMQLVRADALLGGCQQMCRLEPLMQLHMAALKDGADRDGKFAFAGATAPQPGATALDQSDAVKAATARAKRSLRPYNHLQPGDCSRFVMEMRRGKNAHGLSPYPLDSQYRVKPLTCQVYNSIRVEEPRLAA